MATNSPSFTSRIIPTANTLDAALLSPATWVVARVLNSVSIAASNIIRWENDAPKDWKYSEATFWAMYYFKDQYNKSLFPWRFNIDDSPKLAA